MTPRFRRVAVFVGTAALAAGAGVGVAASGDGSSSDRSSSTPGMTRQMGPGGPNADDASGGLTALAEALGVSETRLEQAMRNARPTDPAAGGGPDAMIQALADELGLDADKVREAFESTLGAGGDPPQQQDGNGGDIPAPPNDGQGTTPPATDSQTS